MAPKRAGKFLAKTRQRLRGLIGITRGMKARHEKKVGAYRRRISAQLHADPVIGSLLAENSAAGRRARRALDARDSKAFLAEIQAAQEKLGARLVSEPTKKTIILAGSLALDVFGVSNQQKRRSLLRALLNHDRMLAQDNPAFAKHYTRQICKALGGINGNLFLLMYYRNRRRLGVTLAGLE